jgi:biopolymer transport protein ExbD
VAVRQDRLDVWMLAVDTVYTGVPFHVVLEWVSSGRLAGSDRVRAGQSAWVLVQDHDLLKDYLFQKSSAVPVAAVGSEVVPSTANEVLDLEVGWTKPTEDDDDDVDMIPLIDISLVLLIFFMMTATVASLSPIDVPGLQNAGELSKDVDAITILIDKRGPDPLFSLRAGDRPPEKEDSQLDTLSDLLIRLDARLSSGVARPPEVRIACDKTLPRRHVRELAQELDRRKSKGQIAFYGAEVNELQKP